MYYADYRLRGLERLMKTVPNHIRIVAATVEERECGKCRFFNRNRKQCVLSRCYFFED